MNDLILRFANNCSVTVWIALYLFFFLRMGYGSRYAENIEAYQTLPQGLEVANIVLTAASIAQ